MKICPRCNCPVEENAAFCYNCGSQLTSIEQDTPKPEESEAKSASSQVEPGQTETENHQAPPVQRAPYGESGGYQTLPPYQQGYYPPLYNQFDHTEEFTPKDIAENKVLAMVPYLMGVLGIIVALLAMHSSEYVSFHVKQALKLSVAEVLLGLVSVVLCWTILVPIAGVIGVGIVQALRIIAFFQVCFGKAKEPAIIRNLGFLR